MSSDETVGPMRAIRSMRTITGIVESNNGAEAVVSFADGTRRLFERGAKREAEFLSMFPAGGTIAAKRITVRAACQDIFYDLQDVFGDRGFAYSVSMLNKETRPDISGLTRSERKTREALENFEYVCEVIEKAAEEFTPQIQTA